MVAKLKPRKAKYDLYTNMDAPRVINGPECPKPDLRDGTTPMPKYMAQATRVMSVTLRLAGVDGTHSVNKPGATVLSGNPAAQGRVTGTAKVIQTTNEFGRIEQGDIVVVHFTNSSFNVVMSLCGGIVTNSGGTLSHAGIVSREMGIPCVTDCNDSTNIIPDGAKVLVDGSTGKVYVLALPDGTPVQDPRLGWHQSMASRGVVHA